MKGVRVMNEKNKAYTEHIRMAKSIIKNIVETNVIEFENVEMYNSFFSSPGEPAIVIDHLKQKVDLKLNIKVINRISAIQEITLLQKKIIEEIRAFTGINEVNVDIIIKKFIIYKKNQTHV